MGPVLYALLHVVHLRVIAGVGGRDASYVCRVQYHEQFNKQFAIIYHSIAAAFGAGVMDGACPGVVGRWPEKEEAG